jgi:hypothetical protein
MWNKTLDRVNFILGPGREFVVSHFEIILLAVDLIDLLVVIAVDAESVIVFLIGVIGDTLRG